MVQATGTKCSFSAPRVTSVDTILKNQGIHASSLTNPCPLPKLGQPST